MSTLKPIYIDRKKLNDHARSFGQRRARTKKIPKMILKMFTDEFGAVDLSKYELGIMPDKKSKTPLCVFDMQTIKGFSEAGVLSEHKFIQHVTTEGTILLFKERKQDD